MPELAPTTMAWRNTRLMNGLRWNRRDASPATDGVRVRAGARGEAPRLQESSAPEGSGLHTVPEHAARDHEALDLGGALVDLHDPHVTVVALDHVVLHEPVAAVHLDGLVRHPRRGLGRVELGHARRADEVLAGVLEPSRLADQQPRALDAALHLGQLELHGLDLRDRPAERGTLLRVADGLVARRRHHAQRLGG